MMMPDRKVYVARAFCVMVVIPMAFLAVYPLVYLVLPESFKRLADLPQDLSLVLLFDGIVIPLSAFWLYRRARARELSVPRVLREKMDTRDVY